MNKAIRSRIVRWVARQLGVPIAVHQAYFMPEVKLKRAEQVVGG